MAESKKSSKRIVDVAHPGESAPADTSKPVIVSNRPILKDPMVLEEENNDNSPAQSITVKTSGEKTLEPLTAPELADKPKTAGEKPAEESKASKSSKKDKTAKGDKADDKKTIAQLAEEAKVKDEEDVLAEVLKPASSEPPVQQEASESKATDVSNAQEQPALSAETSTTDDTQQAAEQEDADEKPATDNRSETETAEGAEGGQEADAGNGKGDAPNPEDIDAAAKEQAKKDAAIQELADSKKYYLPINSVEKRRSRRVVILGVLLSIVLAAAWVDIALDAGLVQLNGVKPLTHFFSN